MKVRVVDGRAVDANLARAWSGILDRVPALASPYFRPEFTAAVADVRDDVRVGVMEEDGSPIGFFPYQRVGRRAARPVGGALSDHHGVIAAPEANWTVAALLRGCGLVVFDFDHLQAGQVEFAPYVETRDESPLMLLGEGYEAFARQRREAGSEQIKKTGTLRRKLEREVGELRFEVHETADEPFDRLLVWKTKQYLDSGLTDVFAYDWTATLLRRIRDAQTPDFAGLLSTLYAGDRLVAAHMGMRSRTVWHYWFPAYDKEFGKYSPGLVLLLMMAEAAEELGVEAIDLGKGQALYKDRLANGAILLGQGRVELPSLVTAMHRMACGVESWVREGPLYPIARYPGKLITALRRRKRLR